MRLSGTPRHAHTKQWGHQEPQLSVFQIPVLTPNIGLYPHGLDKDEKADFNPDSSQNAAPSDPRSPECAVFGPRSDCYQDFLCTRNMGFSILS